MQIEKEHRPTIKRSDVEQNKRKVMAIVRAFMLSVENRVSRKMTEAEVNEAMLEPTGENLLAHRRKLVADVKKGMLERKDQEEQIALRAAIVWYNRLDEARQSKIREEWG